MRSEHQKRCWPWAHVWGRWQTGTITFAKPVGSSLKWGEAEYGLVRVQKLKFRNCQRCGREQQRPDESYFEVAELR